MIQWYHIWLFTRIDSIKDYFGGVEFFLVFASIIIVIGTLMVNCSDEAKEDMGAGASKFFSSKWKWIIVFLAFINPLVNRMIPTQKEFAAIYLIPKVVNNEKVQQIATNVGTSTVNLSQIFLTKTEDWLKEQITPPVINQKGEKR